MRALLETKTTRLMPTGSMYALQVATTFLGFTYWKTLKRYKSIDEFRKNYKNK